MYIRTINSEYDKTNFSVIPWQGTVSLGIQCAELVTHVSRLDPHSLQHLSQLQQLSISHCKLSSLPSASLAGLDNLHNLSIHTHPDQDHPVSLDIHQGALAGLYVLQTLDLSHSNIWRLPDNELCGLQSLVTLNMSHNSIKDVKDVGFFNDEDSCR